jgi:hypothetical protein
MEGLITFLWAVATFVIGSGLICAWQKLTTNTTAIIIIACGFLLFGFAFLLEKASKKRSGIP